MKLAAAAILVGSKPTVAEGVPILEEALKDATGDRERTNILIALAVGYSDPGQFREHAGGVLGAAQTGAGIEAAFIDNVLALRGWSVTTRRWRWPTNG